ncbi:MAG: hypothetical protein ACI9DC_003726 [Gammaproteobacteria bacterium]
MRASLAFPAMAQQNDEGPDRASAQSSGDPTSAEKALPVSNEPPAEEPHRPLFKVGEVHWDNFLKRYIWDDDTTPYLVSVNDLTRRQARNELFAYAVFLGFVFGVAALITLSTQAPGGRSPGMSLFSFVMVCGAVLLVTTQHFWAAAVLSAAAPGTLIWLYLFAQHPNLSAIDDAVIVIFSLLWMRYGLRVINIAREYDDMPEGEAPSRTRRRWGQRRR